MYKIGICGSIHDPSYNHTSHSWPETRWSSLSIFNHRHNWTFVCSFCAGDGSVPPGRTAAATPGLLRGAPFIVEGHLMFGVSLSCKAVCSMACSVLSPLHDALDVVFFFSQNSQCCVLLVGLLQSNYTSGGSTFTVGECSFFFSRGPFRVPLRGPQRLLSCASSLYSPFDSAFL